MPQLTTAQIYNAAIPSGSTRRHVNPSSDPSSPFGLHPIVSRKLPGRSRRRNYRAPLWSVAACLKALGILGTFLVAIYAGWLGIAGVAATLAGLTLRYILEATSQGD
jgi:hypothetical protein